MFNVKDAVFQTDALRRLALDHRDALRQLADIEKDLRGQFAGLDDAVLALVLAVLSGEALLLVGPPGTAKSFLIREFCQRVGIDPRSSGAQDGGYFEYLLTPFTEPGELFGFYNIQKASRDGVLERDSQGMMQHARVVYLDEVFNGSSAILNSLLAFMNEGIFHDRGIVVPVATQCVFGATNQMPNAPELQAIQDRFLLRCNVQNMPARSDDLSLLFARGWQSTYGGTSNKQFPGLLDAMRTLQTDVRKLTQNNQLVPKRSSDYYLRLASVVHTCRQYGYSDMSNRRLIKLLHVMLLHAVYEAVKADDLNLITLSNQQIQLMRFALDRWDTFIEDQLELKGDQLP